MSSLLLSLTLLLVCLRTYLSTHFLLYSVLPFISFFSFFFSIHFRVYSIFPLFTFPTHPHVFFSCIFLTLFSLTVTFSVYIYLSRFILHFPFIYLFFHLHKIWPFLRRLQHATGVSEVAARVKWPAGEQVRLCLSVSLVVIKRRSNQAIKVTFVLVQSPRKFD